MIQDEYRKAMAAAGLATNDEIMGDGELHRCHIEGDRPGTRNGWYVLHLDGVPAGSFGSWKLGETRTWCAKSPQSLTHEEQAANTARIAESRRAREAAIQADHERAATEAQTQWAAATPEIGEHRYLRDKGVQAYGIRTDGVNLLVPIRDTAGTIHGLQRIRPNGDKRFTEGAAIAGHYFSIGKPDGLIVICEGYATGASIHEATGYGVAIALNCGNLEAVARALKAKLPMTRIIIAADDDYRTEKNPGITNGRAAALAVGGLLAVPEFGDNRPEGATDFNDQARSLGLESVATCIATAAVPKAEAVPGDGEIWPNPVPLPTTRNAVAELDPALLPDALRPWLVDIAQRMQCPLDFPAIGAMVGLSAVVGRRIGIRPTARTDWVEVPNLWGAIIGRPGALKSPALKEALKPLHKLEAAEREAHAEAIKKWEIEKELAAERQKALKLEYRKANGKPGSESADDLAERYREAVTDECPAPIRRRFVTNDPTVEKLGELLNQNPNGMLVFRDELTGWLRSLDRDGHENDRAFYLEAWAGTGHYTYDRIGRGTLDIEATCVSVIGGIQPGPLSAYVSGAVKGGSAADGLLQRFQLMVWPNDPGEWRNVDRLPDSSARTAAYAVFERLAELDPEEVGATVDEFSTIPALRFSAGGLEAFNEFRLNLEREKLKSGDHEAIESHLSKYRKLVPALALICHLADGGTGPVSEAATLRAIAWAEYLESHARRLYGLAVDPGLNAAHALAVRLRAGEVPNPFTVREVYRKGWSGLTDREATQAAIDYLVDHHWLTPCASRESYGRPSPTYRVNPNLEECA
jgi:putative DNA primase/helicase